jgi:cytochrome c-type biogenesis protein CcmE
MSLARPIQPPIPARRSRWGLLLGIGIVAAVIGWLAFSGIGNALVYYLTPTELLAKGEAAYDEPIRLGGLVKDGTLSCVDGGVDFVLTDGTTEIPVTASSGGLMCPRENVGVVVEGQLGRDGVFAPTQVIVKHDENYVAPSEGEIPSQVIDPGA